MIRERFFEDVDRGYASFSHPRQFDQVWNKVLTFEKELGKSLDDGYTKEEYTALFNHLLVRSAAVFFTNKKVLTYYVRYLIDHGVLPKEQEEIISDISVDDLNVKEQNMTRVRYFKNVHHLHNAIQDTILVADRVDDSVWDIASSILYLAWYGLTEEQILALPKSAVLRDGIIFDGKKIEMPDFVTDVLVRLRDSDGFYTKAKGVVFRKYVFSEYLLRTEDSAQMNINQMRSSLTRMGKVTDFVYSLKYATAYQSGIFYRAYRVECDSVYFDLKDADFASMLFCEEMVTDRDFDATKKLRERTRDYMIYKKLFF